MDAARSKYLHPNIAHALDLAAAAQSHLLRVTEDAQRTCRHERVLTTQSPYDYGDWRRCIQCGKEEHAPAYHTFLFTLPFRPKEDEDHRAVSFSDYVERRTTGLPFRPIQLQSKCDKD